MNPDGRLHMTAFRPPVLRCIDLSSNAPNPRTRVSLGNSLSGGVVVALTACVLMSGGCVSRTRAPVAPPQATSPLVLRIEPNNDESALLAGAQAAAATEDYDTALRIFRDLLQENPTLADAYTGMGEVLEAKGELDLAEPAYARAVALDAQDFSALSGHGRVLEALGRAKDAMRALQRALTIRPRDLRANIAMSRLLLASGQQDSAVAFAERAIRVDPESGMAHLALARAYAKAGRGPEAIREFETACELVNPPEEVMLALINAYAIEKRFREAANAAEALTRTTPSAGAYERLGWALFRLNEFVPSDVAYRKAIEIDGLYWPALNGAGVNALNQWIKNGKLADDPLRNEARWLLQRSLKANPDQPKVGGLLLKYRL